MKNKSTIIPLSTTPSSLSLSVQLSFYYHLIITLLHIHHQNNKNHLITITTNHCHHLTTIHDSYIFINLITILSLSNHNFLIPSPSK